MTDLHPIMEYKITKSITSGASQPDPSHWIVKITAEIFVSSEIDEKIYVGKSIFYFVDIDAGRELSDYSPKALLDITSPTSLFIDLFDDSNSFSEEVEDILQTDPFYCNMFIIDRVEIVQEYRGNGLANLAILDAITLFGGSANVVALKAFPLQMEASYLDGQQDGHDELMALHKFTCTGEEAIQKLGRFYESLGFGFIGNEGLMIKSC